MSGYIASPRMQFFYPGTQSPLASGKLYVYVTGTQDSTTCYPTPDDAANGTNAHANPIVLDSSGTAAVVLTETSRLILKDSSDNLIWTHDGVSPAASIVALASVITDSATGVAIVTNTETNVTSVSLTVGDWDVTGSVLTAPAGTTTSSALKCGLNTVSATLPSLYTSYSAAPAAGVASGITAARTRIQVSSGTTTVYLVAKLTYGVSTLTIGGQILARRMG